MGQRAQRSGSWTPGRARGQPMTQKGGRAPGGYSPPAGQQTFGQGLQAKKARPPAPAAPAAPAPSAPAPDQPSPAPMGGPAPAAPKPAMGNLDPGPPQLQKEVDPTSGRTIVTGGPDGPIDYEHGYLRGDNTVARGFDSPSRTAQSPMAAPAPAPVPAKFAQPAAEFLRRPKTPRGGFQ